MKKLYLLDAYALIFRAYYSMGSNFLYNSKKLNVTAIMGFTRTVWQLIQKEKPSHIAVVFDHKSANVRVQEFEYYKAHRDATPEDIIISEPYIRQIIEAMHIPILEVEGYEADDVIGTLAKRLVKEDYDIYMVTPDKDFAQLVAPNIKIYKPAKMGNAEEIIGVKEVLEKWEISDPIQVIDILALWGDAVDNIPGIPGIGEKTAKELIKRYGSVERLIENAHELKGKQKENVINYSQQGLDSKKLATIILDVPIVVTEKQLLLEPFDKERLRELFSELEFRTLQRDILGESVSQPTSNATTGVRDLFNSGAEEPVEIATSFVTIKDIPHRYQLITSDNEINQLLDILLKASQVAFDTETTSLQYDVLEIVGVSFSVTKGEAYYVPLSPKYEEAQAVLQKFQAFWRHSTILKIAQNLKFDLMVLEKYEIILEGPLYDTMLAHYVLDSDSKHGMDLLSRRYISYDPVHYEDMIGKGVKKRNIRDIPLDEIKEYAAEDADITLQLATIFQTALSTLSPSKEVLEKIEMPLIPVLSSMERHGVALDVDFLSDYSKTLAEEIAHYQDEIFGQAKMTFNLDSPKQLGDVLFGVMKIPSSEKKTKTGQYATGEEILVKLKNDHKIVADILEYRELAKLKSTYVDALPQLISAKTGRLHTSYNQAIAATGRLSSTDPNLQNIPIRTERGRKIREAFVVTDDNFVLLSADYSQIELRLIAALSGDPTMIDAFAKEQDIHRLTASKVLGIPFDEVTKEQRSHAKVVNFGIIYGVSAFGLSQQTSLTMSEAKEMITNYFKTYPKLREYMDNNIALGREQGYVETIMGRRRYLKDINSRNQMMRGMYERIAINAPVQGSAADMIKLAMIDIHHQFKTQKLESFMTLQVHDELVFEIAKSELEQAKKIVLDCMQHAIPHLSVPMIAESGIGKNWYEAH